VVVVALLPGVERELGDGDGVAGHKRVAGGGEKEDKKAWRQLT
jgi:hypothetical protein